MDPTPLQLLLWVWLAAALFMAVLYAVQCRTRDAGIVDAGWALGIGAAALFYAAAADGDPTRRAVVGLLGGLWGLRLGLYLLVNRVLRGGEDGRYRRLREHWGDRAQPWFFVFFQLQASWIVLFSLPLLAAARNGSAFGSVWDVVGIAVWLAAVTGEALADAHLARWRGDPAHRGRTCRAGLWRYSRHPNYFFEWVHWFAYIALGWGSPWWWVTLAGPVVMFAFLYKVTGIPFTEMQAVASRGDDYRAYQRTTSAFFPWFPKGGGA